VAAGLAQVGCSSREIMTKTGRFDVGDDRALHQKHPAGGAAQAVIVKLQAPSEDRHGSSDYRIFTKHRETRRWQD
jgi:hypothetical protein